MADDKVPIRAPVAVRPSFMYSPLNDSLDEFRLMSVLPYQPDTRIQIELCHASMSHASLPGSYRCLSYTWGPPDDTQEISLSGHPFRVRRNLYEFLEQAAKSLCDEKIWVDVLCINQDDDDEKAKQIVKMGLIFHRAKEVLVWLGNDNDLFLFFEWMNSGQGKFGNHAPGRMESTKRAFLQHPYWNRAWITQEILVATSIRVLYSTYSIEWTLFQKLAFLGAQTPHLFFCEWRNVHMDVNQEDCKSPFASWSIWDLLIWRGEAECAIIGDRIFGLLALVHDGASFRVSYRDSAEELFWRAGQHFQAWSSVGCMEELRYTLKLSVPALMATLENPLCASLTIPLSRAFFRSRLRWSYSPEKCRHCNNVFKGKFPYDAYFCTKVTKSTIAYGEDFSHVLLRSESYLGLRGRYSATIVSKIWSDELDLSGLNSNAVVRRLGDELISTDDWRRLREELKNIHSSWELRVPAKFVIQSLDWASKFLKKLPRKT